MATSMEQFDIRNTVRNASISPWNNRNISPPPTVTYSYILRESKQVRAEQHLEMFTEIAQKSGQLQKHLRLEQYTLTRLLYKLHNQLHRWKWYQLLAKVDKMIQRIQNVNIFKCVNNIKECFYKTGQTWQLPSRQMLEYMLVKLMSISKLCDYSISLCEQTTVFLVQFLGLGHLVNNNLTFCGIASRIWVLLQAFQTNTIKWYDDLHSWSAQLKATPTQWLPSGECLPDSLAAWLGSENTSTNLVKKSKTQKLLSKWFSEQGKSQPGGTDTSMEDRGEKTSHVSASLDDIGEPVLDREDLSATKDSNKQDIERQEMCKQRDKTNGSLSTVTDHHSSQPEGPTEDSNVRGKKKKKAKKKKHRQECIVIPEKNVNDSVTVASDDVDIHGVSRKLKEDNPGTVFQQKSDYPSENAIGNLTSPKTRKRKRSHSVSTEDDNTQLGDGNHVQTAISMATKHSHVQGKGKQKRMKGEDCDNNETIDENANDPWSNLLTFHAGGYTCSAEEGDTGTNAIGVKKKKKMKKKKNNVMEVNHPSEVRSITLVSADWDGKDANASRQEKEHDLAEHSDLLLEDSASVNEEGTKMKVKKKKRKKKQSQELNANVSEENANNVLANGTIEYTYAVTKAGLVSSETKEAVESYYKQACVDDNVVTEQNDSLGSRKKSKKKKRKQFNVDTGLTSSSELNASLIESKDSFVKPKMSPSLPLVCELGQIKHKSKKKKILKYDGEIDDIFGNLE